jgi:hypothetical protein
LNKALNGSENVPFSESKLRQEGSLQKHSVQLLCMENIMSYNQILEVEEMKRNLLKEEQIKNQKHENLLKQR